MSGASASVSLRFKGVRALPEYGDDPKQQKKFFEKIRKYIEAGTYWNTSIEGNKEPESDYDPAENETVVLLRVEANPHHFKGLNSREWDLEIIRLLENAPRIRLFAWGDDITDFGGTRVYYALEGHYTE